MLKAIGGFGLFNKTVIPAMLVLTAWHTAVSYLGRVLVVVAPPSQWCFAEDLDTAIQTLDVAALPRGRCQFVDEGPMVTEGGWYTNVSMRQDHTATCPTKWRYDNNEFFTTATMENDWVCGDNWKMYATHMVFWIGSITGFVISGFMADRIGRKKTLLTFIALGGIGNSLGALFSGFVGFTVLRFVTGLGATTVSGAAFVLSIEFTTSHRRSLITLIFGITWAFLGGALPWFGYLVQSWRIMLLSGGVGDLVLIVLVFICVPESPRWLLSVGRKDEAVAALVKVSRANRKTVSEETLDALLQTETDVTGKKASNGEKSPNFLQTTLLVAKSPRIRRLTLAIYFTGFIIGLCYNVMLLQLGRLNLNIYWAYTLAAFSGFPMTAACVPLMDTIGRRWTIMGFLLITAGTCLPLGLLRLESNALTLSLAVVSIMAVAGAYLTTNQMALEVFPTVIRGRAVLLQKLLGEAGCLVGTQVASLAESNTYTPVLVMGVLAAVTAVVALLLPETLEQELPQTIEDGENFGKDQGLWFCPFSMARRARRDRREEKRSRSAPVHPEEEHGDDASC